MDAPASARPRAAVATGSESGVTTDEDILMLKEWGVDALLVGRAFMETENPKALAQRWKKIYSDSER